MTPPTISALLACVRAKNRPGQIDGRLVAHIDELVAENERLRAENTQLRSVLADPYVRANRLSVERFERDNQRVGDADGCGPAARAAVTITPGDDPT